MSEISPKSTREERLAAKLRENLKRRKVQARLLTADDNTDDSPETSPASTPGQDTLSKGAEDR